MNGVVRKYRDMVERRNLGNLSWEEVEKNQRVTNEKIIDIFSTLPLQ